MRSVNRVIPSVVVIQSRAFCGEGSPAYKEIPRYARDDMALDDSDVQDDTNVGFSL